MTTFVQQPGQRNARGSLGALLLASLLLITVALGALAVDFAHMLAVRNELQNATDAGALSGAQDLWTDVSSATSDAYTVTGYNRADGRIVANQSPGTAVNVTVTPPVGFSGPGTVQVDATMQTSNLFASFFGRPTETISVTSIAGTTGNLFQLYADQAFPLAVSLDAVPRSNNVDGTPLNQCKIGDTVQFYINSQQVKNAAFTSFTVQPASASYIQSAVEQALGLAPVIPGFVPAIAIGDQINVNNGVIGQKKLAKGAELQALLDPSRPVLTVPVVTGDPALNQSRPVVGFVGLRVTGVTLGNGGGVVETITAVLERPQVKGMSGPPLDIAGGGLNGTALNNLVLGPVQLIR